MPGSEPLIDFYLIVHAVDRLPPAPSREGSPEAVAHYAEWPRDRKARLNVSVAHGQGDSLCYRPTHLSLVPPIVSIPPSPTFSGQQRARELDSSLNLAGLLYWDPEVFSAEMDRLFWRRWLCVGRSDDLERSGDFVTREVGVEPILVIRGDEGELRAFYNVCRHRGTRLLERRQGSDLDHILCPYHGWAYTTSKES